MIAMPAMTSVYGCAMSAPLPDPGGVAVSVMPTVTRKFAIATFTHPAVSP